MVAINSPSANGHANQDSKGRFVPGNAAAANPISRAKRRLRAARVAERVTDETWDAIIDTMVALATDKSRPSSAIKAASWIADRVMGPIKQSLEIIGEDPPRSLAEKAEEIRARIRELRSTREENDSP